QNLFRERNAGSNTDSTYKLTVYKKPGSCQSLYEQRQGARLIVPRRRNMAAPPAAGLARACGRWRRIVETVGSQLTERFGIARIRVRDLWHYQHRLIRKILAHTVAVFLNLQLGRDPLDLDGLVSV